MLWTCSATFAQRSCGPPDSGPPSCQAAAGNPINLINGNKYQREVDLPALPGVLGIEIVRHYNSSLAYEQSPNGVIGRGWRLSYETELMAIGTTVQILQADGRRLVFNKNPANPSLCAGTDPAQGVIRIAGNGNKTEYTWVGSEGRKQVFDAEGRLQRMLAPTGEVLVLTRAPDGKLLRVTDPQGRQLSLQHLDRATSNRNDRFKGIRTIDSPVGRFTYGYGQGVERSRLANLVSVGYPPASPATPAQVRRYHYEDERHPGLLTGISTGITGNFTRLSTYSYDGNGEARQSRHGVEMVVLDRSEAGKTTVTDGLGRITTVTHAIIGNEYRVLESRGAGCPGCGPANVRYRYDTLGRMTDQTRLDHRGQPVETRRTRRDELGRISAEESIEYRQGKAQPPRLLWRSAYEGAVTRPARIFQPSVVAGREAGTFIRYNKHGQIAELKQEGFSPLDSKGAISPLAPTQISRTTTYRYKTLGGKSKLIETDGPLPNGPRADPSDSDITRYEYDRRGNQLIRIVYPTGIVASLDHDDAGRLISRQGLDGVTEHLAYDPQGRITRLERAGRRMLLDYDAGGRIREVRDALNQRLTLRYGEDGQLIELSDTAGNRIAWNYAADGSLRELQLLNPDGSISQRRGVTSNVDAESSGTGFESLLLQNDALFAGPGPVQGQRTAIDSEGRVTRYYYDDFAQRVLEASPVSGQSVFSYDAAGKLVARITPAGATRISRDPLGRAVRLQAPGEEGRIEYGAANKPVRITYREGEERFEYDEAARLIRQTRIIDGKRFVTAYEFDELGRTAKKHLPDGQVLAYRYNDPLHPFPGLLAGIDRENAGGLLRTPIIAGLNTAQTRFNDRGFIHGNGLRHHSLLDEQGQPLRVGSRAVAESRLQWNRSDASLRQVDYRYPIAIGNPAPAEALLPWSERWTAGLTQFAATLPEPATGTASLADTAVGSRYDAAGRLIEDAQRRYTWDGLDRLIEVKTRGQNGQPETPLARYRYNLFGERIAKVVHPGHEQSVTYFFYDGSELTAEADQAGTLIRQYVYLEGSPVALLPGRSILAIASDHRKAPLAVTDQSRTVVWRASLGYFGAAAVAQGSSIDLPLRGSNQYYDAETGLHYNTHRYLDAGHGRYLSPDPLGLAVGPDLYQFALGQPHQFVDPLGLQPKPIVDGQLVGWTYEDKLREIINRTVPLLPGEIRGQVGGALKEMVQPENLAIMGAIFTVWAASQFTPYGWMADIAILGIGLYVLGTGVFDLLDAFITLHSNISAAQQSCDLDAASSALANGLVEASGELGGGAGAAAGAVKLGKSIRQITKYGRRQMGQPTELPTSRTIRPPSSHLKYPADMSPWKNPDGTWRYPTESDGFPHGAKPATIHQGELPVGTLVDRYGTEDGNFLAPKGTPPEMRSLPPTTIDHAPYRIYRIKRALPVQSGETAPWFGQPGGGVQYRTERTIDWYMSNGYLEVVGGPA